VYSITLSTEIIWKRHGIHTGQEQRPCLEAKVLHSHTARLGLLRSSEWRTPMRTVIVNNLIQHHWTPALIAPAFSLVKLSRKRLLWNRRIPIASNQ
jgi:hypothetical protein